MRGVVKRGSLRPKGEGMIARCSNCRFFQLVDETAGEDDKAGECRRRAPVLRSKPVFAQWVSVELYNWCGEWEEGKRLNRGDSE